MNKKNIYSPEFIPFYIKEVKEYGLSPLEGLAYGFIRFYTKNNNNFYFNSEDFAQILNTTANNINNIIGKLKKKNIIEVKTKTFNKGGFKSIRNIQLKEKINKKEIQNIKEKEIEVKNKEETIDKNKIINNIDDLVDTINRLFNTGKIEKRKLGVVGGCIMDNQWNLNGNKLYEIYKIIQHITYDDIKYLLEKDYKSYSHLINSFNLFIKKQ